MTRVEAAVSALRDALEKERAAIRAGRLDLIVRLAENREVLLRELGAAAESAPDTLGEPALMSLRGDIARNQHMLAAAAKGIKGVVERIAEIRETAGRLTTYGADGVKTEHLQGPAQRKTLERKA